MNPYEIDTVEVDGQIDRHLKRLPKKYIPAYFDFDDFRQNIYLALLVRSARYDPARCSKRTFQDRVIRHYIIRFVLSLRWRKNQSLEGVAFEKRGTDFVFNDVHRGELNGDEQYVFAGEVQAVIDALDDEQRDICELLKHFTLTETASLLNIPHAKVHRRVAHIRSIMARAGVRPGNYLEKS